MGRAEELHVEAVEGRIVTRTAAANDVRQAEREQIAVYARRDVQGVAEGTLDPDRALDGWRVGPGQVPARRDDAGQMTALGRGNEGGGRRRRSSRNERMGR